MEKPCQYCLLIEVDPEKGGPYLDWLLGGHIGEVAAYPGFLSGKMTKFEEKAGDGWDIYLVAYQVENREALEAYWQSDFFKVFKRKAVEFEGTFRIKRFSGDVVLDIS